MSTELKPCPFCGTPFEDDSYDRGIVYKCVPCGFRRGFPGYLQNVVNDSPIPYVDEKGQPVPPDQVKYQEYYHYDARDKAIEKMNQRAEENVPA